VILTNWPAMAGTNKAPGGAAHHKFLFGFAVMPDNRVVDEGERSRAATGWCIASSPTGDAVHPAQGELDFALIRLAQLKAGQTRRDEKRGRVKLSMNKPDFLRLGIAILQHPQLDGAAMSPLKLTFSATEQVRENSSQERVEYSVPTEHRASGAPVFALSTWEMIALHQAGFEGRTTQGVPTWKIAVQQNVRNYLDSIPAID